MSSTMQGNGTGPKSAQPEWAHTVPSRPVVIASGNGLGAAAKTAALILAGVDTLDALIAGVNLVEADPAERSVGYGGLPNEDGVVELDACVMHGPTRGAGAVAALRNIRMPSRVARLVMERTDHSMLTGDGALRFARAQGFEEEDLLTPEAREEWLRWRQSHPPGGNWLSPVPPEVPDEPAPAAGDQPEYTRGTVCCCALDAAGDLSGVTSTSGLSYRLPGRVADSSIVGAGLYVDNAVGVAGATGRGEACTRICGAHTIVESMRHGLSPLDACLEALRRVVTTTIEPRLLRRDGRPNFNLTFYALAKDSRYGAASLWSGKEFALCTDGRTRLEECAYLFRHPRNG